MVLTICAVSDVVSGNKVRIVNNMSSRRVSYEQLETLWEFLNRHKDIAMGYNKSAQARAMSRRIWAEVTQSLNSIVGGAIKDSKGWAAYWVDYKGKLKRKCAGIGRAQSSTGGGPAAIELTLSDIEKKYLGILGNDYGLGLPGIQVDPFDIEITDPLPPSPANSTPLSESILGIPGTSQTVEETVHELILPTPAIEDNQPPVPQQIEHGPSTQPRRVQRRQQLSQEAVRRALVDSSRMRAEATQGMLNLMTEATQGLLNILTRIATILERGNN